jgi:CheY-like chemotaxis protein
MEANDGWMELDSAPGRGTTVTLGVTPGALPSRDERPDAASTRPVEPELAEVRAPARGPGGSPPKAGPRLPAQPIRVLLVDDHAMVRQGLRSILNGYPDLDIIAEAGDGEEAVTLAALLKPDLIVMDVNLPRLDGVEATRRIRQTHPEALVVGLSVNQADHVVQAMKAAGAAAFLTKESAADQLYETIGGLVGVER